MREEEIIGNMGKLFVEMGIMETDFLRGAGSVFWVKCTFANLTLSAHE